MSTQLPLPPTHNFPAGTQRAKIAELLIQGVDRHEILKRLKVGNINSVHAVAHDMRKRATPAPGELPPIVKPNGHAPTTVLTSNGEQYDIDKWGYTVGSYSAKCAALVEQGTSIYDLMHVHGISKSTVYAVRHGMKKARTRDPSLPEIVSAKNVGRSGGRPPGTTKQALTVRKVTSLKARKKQVPVEDNASFGIALVECRILRADGTESARVFAPVEIFPQVYARALKATGSE